MTMLKELAILYIIIIIMALCTLYIPHKRSCVYMYVVALGGGIVWGSGYICKSGIVHTELQCGKVHSQISHGQKNKQLLASTNTLVIIV